MAVLRPLKLVIENWPEGRTETLEAINNPEDPVGRHAPDHLRPRALHRARRLHGESAEEVLPPRAGPRGAAALRLLRHLPRGGEECRWRGGGIALHLRSGDARRQRAARRTQGAGDAALGGGGGRDRGGGAAVQSPVHASRSRCRRRHHGRYQSGLAGGAAPAACWSRRSPRRRSARRCSSNGWAISAPIRIPRRAGRCSTARSACATPGRRCRGAANQICHPAKAGTQATHACVSRLGSRLRGNDVIGQLLWGEFGNGISAQRCSSRMPR